MLISVTCPEITIKGTNRRSFEHMLMRNIRAALPKAEVEISHGRMLIKGVDPSNAIPALERVFGIETISACHECKPDINDLSSFVLSQSQNFSGKTVMVDTKRADKRFPFTSQKVNELVGAVLHKAGFKVDLTRPQQKIHIEILADRALVSFEKRKGLGGMPVGSSGKLLSLLSGGIDSPVSSWLMMKRGCSVDMLHVHQFPENKDVLQSKIVRIAKTIRKYSPQNIRLFVVPYSEFYKKSTEIDSKREVVVFRRFLFRLGSSLSSKFDYQGLVCGDSVAQVASQTLANIRASEVSAFPVFRPLAAFNKSEIIEIAQKIGTFETSLEEYKDCCSLVASRNPSTNTPPSIAEKIEGDIGMEEIVRKSIEKMEAFDF